MVEKTERMPGCHITKTHKIRSGMIPHAQGAKLDTTPYTVTHLAGKFFPSQSGSRRSKVTEDSLSWRRSILVASDETHTHFIYMLGVQVFFDTLMLIGEFFSVAEKYTQLRNSHFCGLSQNDTTSTQSTTFHTLCYNVPPRTWEGPMEWAGQRSRGHATTATHVTS